jgi:hypothetical protein
MVGRLTGIQDGKAQFSGSLHNQCALSDLKMNRLLTTIDDWAASNGVNNEVEPPIRLPPTHVPGIASSQHRSQGCRNPCDRMGDGLSPGLLVAGSPGVRSQGSDTSRRRRSRGAGHVPVRNAILRRRKSALIDGAGDDAGDLGDHLLKYLNRAVRLN